MKSIQGVTEIHDSLINGKHEQMVQKIDEYGVIEFLGDYTQWLDTLSSGSAVGYGYIKEILRIVAKSRS